MAYYHKTGALKITKDASIETVAIALSLAEKLFDGDLTIKGSKKFKSRCQYTSADLDLKINFHDKSISENVKKLKEEKIMTAEIKSEEFQEEVVSDNLQEEKQDEEEARHFYPSETLQNVPEKFLPPRESVCHTCPNAMLLYVEKELRCWCKE